MSRGELIVMSDSYTRTLNQVERDAAAKRRGTGWRNPSVEDVQGVDVTDLGVEQQYYPGSLRAAAAAAVLTKAIAATIEVQFGGEEGLPA